ncbi:MAG: hypothetical protein COB94_002560, partial [Gammaproteobacteria bacterium]|nr:hypothetical protein [Gammaproteobacteria bacterium]
KELSEPLTLTAIKAHFQGDEIINNDFYMKLNRGALTRERLEKTISNHVNHTTAARLKVELTKSFGGSSKGRFDLNGTTGGTHLRLFQQPAREPLINSALNGG